MKMKKSFATCFFVVMATCFTTCSIEQEVYNKINPDIYPLNAKEADALLMANVYNVFTPSYIFNAAWGWHILSMLVADEIECNWAATYIGFDMTTGNNHWTGSGGYPVTDESRNPVYYYYKFLSRMTLTEDRIKDVPMDENLKERMYAEIYCGKGLLALLEYDLYGTIPLPGREVLYDPLADVIISRATEEEMRTYIEDHLLEAAKVLPYKYEDSDYGRFTKGCAKMSLLKFYMMTHQWDKAEVTGRELMNPDYGYALVADYNSLFTEGGEKNQEVIFSGVSELGMSHNWIAHFVTNDYPTPGQELMKWGVFKMRWDFYHTFEEGDNRTLRIIPSYTTATGLVHDEETDTKYAKGEGIYYGPVPIKYDYSTTIGEECPVDIPLFRYADVITLLSEAIVRNNGGITAEALDLLNRVRVRAGLPAYLMNDFTDKDDFLDKLLLERAHELWAEGHRRQDLIRHGKFIEAGVRKGEKAGLTTARIEKMKQQTISGKYDFELFPIPTSAINEGQGLIHQNPGY